MKTLIAAFTLALPLACRIAAAEDPAARHPEERDGAATIIHRASVVPERSTRRRSIPEKR